MHHFSVYWLLKYSIHKLKVTEIVFPCFEGLMSPMAMSKSIQHLLWTEKKSGTKTKSGKILICLRCCFIKQPEHGSKGFLTTSHICWESNSTDVGFHIKGKERRKGLLDKLNGNCLKSLSKLILFKNSIGKMSKGGKFLKKLWCCVGERV